jgi:hypothetical protein
MSSPRDPFTDGFNSLSHFVFGVASIYYPIAVPIYLTYQFQRITLGDNSPTDIKEFGIGWFLGYLSQKS